MMLSSHRYVEDKDPWTIRHIAEAHLDALSPVHQWIRCVDGKTALGLVMSRRLWYEYKDKEPWREPPPIPVPALTTQHVDVPMPGEEGPAGDDAHELVNWDLVD